MSSRHVQHNWHLIGHGPCNQIQNSVVSSEHMQHNIGQGPCIQIQNSVVSSEHVHHNWHSIRQGLCIRIENKRLHGYGVTPEDLSRWLIPALRIQRGPVDLTGNTAAQKRHYDQLQTI